MSITWQISCAQRTEIKIGNPLSDGVWDYTWQQGRQLASMSRIIEDNSTESWSFVYDANGMRLSRSTGTGADDVTYTYVYTDGLLTRMTKGDITLYFTYDAAGTPLTVSIHTGTYCRIKRDSICGGDCKVYYYVTNLQGDVIAILDEAGNEVAEYSYDAWGRLLCDLDEDEETIYSLNPLFYRGYVYDRETGLYYLQSRYYNPEIGRFISADNVMSDVGGDILGNNLFAYCLNNPVMLVDLWGTASTIAFSDNLDIFADPIDEATSGGGGVGVLVVLLPNSTTRADAPAITDAKKLENESSKRIYTVYFLYSKNGSPNQIVYVGRVKTKNFDSRMAYHSAKGRVLSFYVSELTWEQCRGLEQVGMMFFHSLNRDDPIYNQIRGVSPTNGSRSLYFDAAKTFWSSYNGEYSSYMPYSYWENWTENEFLNGISP